MVIPSPSARHFLIFSTLSTLYVLSMFYRASNAVIAPNLMADLHLDAEALGWLGGAFFYSFALIQLPLGPMLDRIGPRFIITCFSLAAALGAILFGLGQSFTAALWGRILIGIGMASILMSALKVFLLHFPQEKFSTFVGILMASGALGNLLASSPMAFLNDFMGWRSTFVFAGIATALVALLAHWALGSEETKKESVESLARTESSLSIPQSIRRVLGALSFWQISAIMFFRYGTFVSLQGLWLGPYLMDVHGYSPAQAGNLLAVMAVGAMAGGPIGGWVADKSGLSIKGTGLGIHSFYCLTLFLLAGVSKTLPPFLYALHFLAMGFSNGFSAVLVLAHARLLFPINISGTAMTFINFFTMAGGAVFMPLLGKVIESFPPVGGAYPAEAYHRSFLFCLLGMAASSIFYAFSKKGG
jgi:MFS family permease